MSHLYDVERALIRVFQLIVKYSSGKEKYTSLLSASALMLSEESACPKAH